MVERQVNPESVESLRLEQLGEGWIRAIRDGALEQLEQFCQPEMISHVLTPKKYLNFDNVTDLVAKFHQWFDECSDIQAEHSRVELVGEKLGISYRFLLQEQGSWCRIEQQIYCAMQDGRIAQLHLLCSGFQPAALDGQAAAADEQQEGMIRDALLEIHTGAMNSAAISAAISASTCAVLTPAIKSKLREMQSGQVLEVRVDDLSAKEDIEAWCRLSGNPLLGLYQAEGPEMRFLVKKK